MYLLCIFSSRDWTSWGIVLLDSCSSFLHSFHRIEKVGLYTRVDQGGIAQAAHSGSITGQGSCLTCRKYGRGLFVYHGEKLQILNMWN